jgi:hypothetical protein
MMPGLLTADNIILLVASLTAIERIRLLRWIASPQGKRASVYAALPTRQSRGRLIGGKIFVDSGQDPSGIRFDLPTNAARLW